MSNRSEGAMRNYDVPMIAKSWYREVMVAGLVIMACVSARPSTAAVHPNQVVDKMFVVRGVEAEPSPFVFGAPPLLMPTGSAMAQATPPPFQGCPSEGSCTEFELPLFPPPSDSGTPPPDGGVVPQAGAPVLNTPALLVTKPRVVPDLEGRFSNGGNEEIW